MSSDLLLPRSAPFKPYASWLLHTPGALTFATFDAANDRYEALTSPSCLDRALMRELVRKLEAVYPFLKTLEGPLVG